MQVKAQAEAEGKLLPQWHPSVRAVQRVGLRIASVAGDGHGGGYQEHMKVRLPAHNQAFGNGQM